jgi:hypothetical protein
VGTEFWLFRAENKKCLVMGKNNVTITTEAKDAELFSVEAVSCYGLRNS